jgi:prefoldin subunit 5
MATATKRRTPGQLRKRIDGLKAREAKLAEALTKVRTDRKLYEQELKDIKAATTAARPLRSVAKKTA